MTFHLCEFQGKTLKCQKIEELAMNDSRALRHKRVDFAKGLNRAQGSRLHPTSGNPLLHLDVILTFVIPQFWDLQELKRR
jgi:hypothetical protein